MARWSHAVFSLSVQARWLRAVLVIWLTPTFHMKFVAGQPPLPGQDASLHEGCDLVSTVLLVVSFLGVQARWLGASLSSMWGDPHAAAPGAAAGAGGMLHPALPAAALRGMRRGNSACRLGKAAQSTAAAHAAPGAFSSTAAGTSQGGNACRFVGCISHCRIHCGRQSHQRCFDDGQGQRIQLRHQCVCDWLFMSLLFRISVPSI